MANKFELPLSGKNIRELEQRGKKLKDLISISNDELKFKIKGSKKTQRAARKLGIKYKTTL